MAHSGLWWESLYLLDNVFLVNRGPAGNYDYNLDLTETTRPLVLGMNKS